jgi:hypothetical protein
MRFLLLLILIVPAFAQDPPAQTKPAEQPAAAPAKAEETPSPAPPTEQWLTGSIDFGYRFLTDVRGNFQSYRSVVNLGEGPKLFNLDFTVQPPKTRLFDRIDVRLFNWGGDPYNTAHVGVVKRGGYEFNFDYRNIAYFNAMPSFANPLAPAGFNERSFDTTRHVYDATLDIHPGKRIVPYLAYGRNSQHGLGVTTYVQDANEFAVPERLRDSMDNYRGGLRFEFRNWHITVEQGATHFKDDDQLYETQRNLGDRTTPFSGQQLTMTSLQASYFIRGYSNYTRAMTTATPFSWLTVSGQFLFSQPETSARYSDAATGNFVVLSQVLFYNSQTDFATSSAKQPHVVSNLGFEARPFHRLRIIESWMTDRYHDAGFGGFTQQILTPASAAGSTSTSLPTLQVVNYNQNQVDALFDITSKLTLRGGYRRVWGDASVRAGSLSQTGPQVSGELNRNVGIAGVSFRTAQKLWVNLDYEAAAGDRVYFRTSLNDYHKVRARARYQPTQALSFQANFTLLDNQNPDPAIRYDFRARDNSLSVFWTPANGKRITLMGEYDRSTLRSDISYLDLPFLTPAVSKYRDNAHTATSAIDVVLPGYSKMTPKLTVGGSLFISSGSRPTRYFQPLFRLALPIHKQISWNTEWRYYGFGEDFYLYEGFRTHVFQTGLRVTR